MAGRELRQALRIVFAVVALGSLCTVRAVGPGEGCEQGPLGRACHTHAPVHSLKEYPAPPAPGYQESRRLEDVGVDVIRVTREGMFGPGDYRASHRYSRRQAWNADETLIDLNRGLIRSEDFSVHADSIGLSSERNWSNVDPSLMYGIRYSPDPIEFGELDVHTGEFRSLARFDGFVKCTLGEGEGNVSNDDRLVVFVCHREDGSREMISYDIVERRELGRRSADEAMNWVSFTQSGNFIVLENNVPDAADDTERIIRYDRDFLQPVILTTDRDHGDLGIDVAGSDVLVMMDWYRIRYVDIATGRVTLLGIVDRGHPFSHGHVSCRNIRRPGWCYVSGNDAGVIGAVRLAPDPSLANKVQSLLSNKPARDGSAFELWGYHYSNNDDYTESPKVSASPSGRQLIFSSDWADGARAEDYVVRPSD